MSPIPEPRPADRFWFFEPFLYLVLALLMTWPLGYHIQSHIPLGTEDVATVPLFNLWTLWWNADRISNLYQGYWNAPIFYPLEGTFALSEPQPLTGLVAAVLRGLTGSPVFAYNGVLLLALTLNGWAACRLLCAVGLGRPASLSSGLMVQFLPFVHQELGVLQLVSLGGVIATLLALVRLCERPDWIRGSVLGLAFAATALTCGTYALSLSVLLLFGGGWLLGSRLGRRITWEALAAAGLVALVLTLPAVRPQLRIAETYGLERSASTVKRFSAHWNHYRYTPWPELLPTPGIATAPRPGGRAFWPGTLKVGLALFGFIWGLRRGPRRWTAFCGTVLFFALLLSFGPGSGGLSLHRLLAHAYPGFAQLRSPFRFAVFVQLMIGFLAAGGLAAMGTRPRWSRLWRGAVVLCLGILAAVEVRSPGPSLLPLPEPEARLPWLDWVDSHTRPDDVLAFLPLPTGRGTRDYLETTQWMFWQMGHGRPMVNGYSGFFPKPFRDLKATLQDFPDPASLESLASRGVRYCVVIRGVYDRSRLDTLATPDHGLQHVFSDDVARLDIYQVVRSRRR